jgi:hypothetical protein
MIVVEAIVIPKAAPKTFVIALVWLILGLSSFHQRLFLI